MIAQRKKKKDTVLRVLLCRPHASGKVSDELLVTFLHSDDSLSPDSCYALWIFLLRVGVAARCKAVLVHRLRGSRQDPVTLLTCSEAPTRKAPAPTKFGASTSKRARGACFMRGVMKPRPLPLLRGPTMRCVTWKTSW